MNSIFLCNSIAVGFFGMILSASFCDIYWTSKKRLSLFLYMAVLMSIQGIAYGVLGGDMVKDLYPLIMHIPLGIGLGIMIGKYLWAFIAILTSYLCCQLRRWLALLVVAIVPWDVVTQASAEIILTIPLLVLLLKFVSPSLRYISHNTWLEQARFGILPLLCYAFDYITRVYTDWLNEGDPVVVEFMFFICSVVYLVSVIQSSVQEKKRSEMEQMQGYLNLQIMQSVREIETLRRSQEKASIYRHDLRHHMRYISSCIENGRVDQIKEYIQEICSEIEASKVVVYSENEVVNLILSAFVTKAEEQKIPIEIHMAIPVVCAVSESDLCVLLSNALENALHACQKRKEKGAESWMRVDGFEKHGKLFFEISNSCDETVRIQNGIPVSDKLLHGIGVRSICAIVDKYKGMYTFFVKDGRFVLRVSL